MIYAHDWEFLEDGRTIDPISVGIVAADGRELYLINDDADWARIAEHEWLMTNVVPYLPVTRRRRNGPLVPDVDHPAVVSRSEMAERVRTFITGRRDDNELWASYGAYDHLALCQLFGRMIDLPDSIPMFTHDLQQELRRRRVHAPGQALNQHKAIDDARWVMDRLRWLDSLGVARPIVQDDAP